MKSPVKAAAVAAMHSCSASSVTRIDRRPSLSSATAPAPGPVRSAAIPAAKNAAAEWLSLDIRRPAVWPA